MATRRHGSLTAFWNSTAVTAGGAGGTSGVAEIGRNVGDLALYVISGGALTAKIQVAHSGGDVGGIGTDAGPAGSAGSIATAPYDAWFDLYYAGSAASNLMQVVLAGAGNASLIIPDFSSGWIRLVATAGTAVTVTAGYEVASA
jgi:hypothetical protein